MLLFIIGIIILFVGGFFYSKYVEKQLQPDDRPTPAVKKADGVDYVVMSKRKTGLSTYLTLQELDLSLDLSKVFYLDLLPSWQSH